MWNLQDFDGALPLQQQEVRRLAGLGFQAATGPSPQAARQLFALLGELRPEQDFADAGLVLACIGSGQLSQALKAAETGKARHGATPALLLYEGMAYLMLGYRHRSERLLQQVLRDSADDSIRRLALSLLQQAGQS